MLTILGKIYAMQVYSNHYFYNVIERWILLL